MFVSISFRKQQNKQPPHPHSQPVPSKKLDEHNASKACRFCAELLYLQCLLLWLSVLCNNLKASYKSLEVQYRTRRMASADTVTCISSR